jgi:hypothetical protein
VKLLETGDIRCVYGICKLLRTVFFDVRIQNQFVDCEGFYYLAYATTRLSSYLVTSSDARKALEQISNLLVTSAQISSLQFVVGEMKISQIFSQNIFSCLPIFRLFKMD